MAEQKRVRRTPEQIAADIDGQISKLEENIRGLEERKPRKSKAERIRELVKQAQKSGMKLDEIAEKLGMPLSE